MKSIFSLKHNSNPHIYLILRIILFSLQNCQEFCSCHILFFFPQHVEDMQVSMICKRSSNLDHVCLQLQWLIACCETPPPPLFFRGILLKVSEYHTLVGAVGWKAVWLLKGMKMDLLAGLTLAIEANRLDLNDIVCILLQVPKNARTAGCVDLPDESLHVSILPLNIWIEEKQSDNELNPVLYYLAWIHNKCLHSVCIVTQAL